MKDLATQQQTIRQGEIVIYQPDETIRLEVRLENDTVWLNRQQLAQLFGRDVKTIGKHITNALKEELRNVSTVAKFAIVQMEGNREVTRTIEFYNLDMVISVGYRVKSEKGIEFRIWANKVIKEYLLHGYAVNQQLMRMEQRFDEKLDAQQNRIRMIESAKREIILIDNYIDAMIFDLLEKREQGVDATIYTEHAGQSLQHLQQLYQQQYERNIEVKEYNNRFHDRFLILDDALYHFGASFKDLGKCLFAFELMGIDKSIILSQL